MKKFKKSVFFGAFIVALGAFTVVACEKEELKPEEEVANQEITNNRVPKPVVITVSDPGSFSAGIFGCWGSGRCYYDIIVYEDATSLIQNNGNGTVTVVDLLSVMSAENFDYYTTNDFAELLEPSELSEEDCIGLELPVGTTLQPGVYPITIEGDNAIVTYDIN